MHWITFCCLEIAYVLVTQSDSLQPSGLDLTMHLPKDILIASKFW